MKRLHGLCLVAVILLSGCGLYPTKYQTLDTKDPNHLRVASYNINWREGAWTVHHPENNINTIKISNADIVLLQETTEFWEKAIAKQLGSRYAYHAYEHYHSSGGLGVLSKYPITKKQTILASHGWFPAYLLTIKTPQGPVQLLNLHMIPPLTENNRIGFMLYTVYVNPLTRKQDLKTFLSYLNPQIPTIIAGDFNEGDNGPSVQLVRKKGYEDAIWPLPYEVVTWHWPVGPFTFTARYDRLFYSNDLRLDKIAVLYTGDSDHFPVIVDFGLTASGPPS